LRSTTEPSFPGVRVLWATEVVGVGGHDRLPFDVARIVDVRADPEPEQEPDENAPL
jgi:hypothetical protein